MRVRLRVDVLRQFLAASALSQNHWALRLEFARGHWSEIVNGKHPYPSARSRQRMVEVLGLPFEDLFEIEQADGPTDDTDFRMALADRYLIDRELGQGGMGTVFLARDLARGRVVAVKAVSPEAVSGIGVPAFLREISTVAQLHHPNILPLYDSGVAAGHPFLVMPWVREGSLRDRLDRQVRLDVATVAKILAGLAAALDHAHRERILHCDVKPANVLLFGDHPYLMDFGISRAIHAEASEWRARKGLDLSAGTPAYVSPEQANGDADLDGRSDVYSLGCVVYEMLTGRAPFEGTSTEAVVAQRFLKEPVPIREFAPEVPAGVAAEVEAAMRLERTRRTGSPGEFARQLGDRASARRSVLAPVSVWAARRVGAVRQRLGRPSSHPIGAAPMKFMRDLRLAFRQLTRSPRFAAAAIVPLALGLGAGAVLFGMVDHLVIRPPPGVVDPGRVVRLAVETPRRDGAPVVSRSVSWIDYRSAARDSTAFAGVAAYFPYRVSLGRGPEARRILIALTTASFFPTLGVSPGRGRFFRDEEDVEGVATMPCVVSERFWRTTLGGSDTALGSELQVGSLVCEVVGVAPRGFEGIDVGRVDLWAPLRAGASDVQGNDSYLLWETDNAHWIQIVARLGNGVTVGQGASRATAGYRTFADRRRDPELKGAMVVEPLITGRGPNQSTQTRTTVWLAIGAGLLLLLVVANVANLFIARALERTRETAIRLAVGGGRAALFRHQLLESGMLAVIAGVASVALARLVEPTLARVLLPGVSRAGSFVDWRVGLVAAGVAALVGTLVAVVTSVQAGRVQPASMLRSAGSLQTTGSRGSRRARLGLVGLQATLSTALLVTSIGFVQSFRRALLVDVGFDPGGVVSIKLPLGSIGYTPEQETAYYRQLRERLLAEPGVLSASLGYTGPWTNNRTETVSIPGRDSLPPVPNFGSPAFDAVTPDYPVTMGIQLVAGRWITEADRPGGAPVVVVNRALTELYWPAGESAVGRCLRIGADTMPCREIVGVAENHLFTGPIDAAPTAAYFLPFDQAVGAYRVSPTVFVRVDGDPERFLDGFARLAQGLAPNLPASSVRTVQSQLDPLLARWRLGAVVFTGLGLLASLIAAGGLISVLAFQVAERRREFAIRAALGAVPRALARSVMRQGTAVVGVGVLLGVAVCWLANPFLDPLLFRTRLLDPAVLAVVTGVMLAIAATAAGGPARRAAAGNPVEIMRAQ